MNTVRAIPREHDGPPSCQLTDDAQDHLRQMLALHFHPEMGSPYWLKREKGLGINVLQEVRGLDDLYKLGPMDDTSLRGLPIEQFIPRMLWPQKEKLILGDSAGSTGTPKITAYTEEDFQRGFVEPFANAAAAMQFPEGENWLFIGPSGPHIIGKAARACARRLKSMDPFMVDFDPRWIKRMGPGSMGHKRYLDHIMRQAMDILSTQDVGVLFTTPAILAPLAEHMTKAQRLRIRGVHYGGIALTAENYADFRENAFPNAVHMSGFGNTLFGMCPELIASEPRLIDYYPHGDRVVIRLIPISKYAPLDGERLRKTVDYGERGQIMFHRLDRSGLIVNMCERDSAERIPPPFGFSRFGFHQDGLRRPEPLLHVKKKLRTGLY